MGMGMGGHGHGHGHGRRPCAPAAPSPRRTSVLCCVLLPVCALEGLAEPTTDCVHGGDGMPTRRHALGETRSGLTEHSPARTLLLLLLRTRMRRWMARARAQWDDLGRSRTCGRRTASRASATKYGQDALLLVAKGAIVRPSATSGL